MRALLGWAFDMWVDFWFAVGVVVDSALDVWSDDD